MGRKEIAERLGLSESAIGRDLAEVRKRWRDAQLFNFDEAKARELAVIDDLQLQAQEALLKSKQKRTKTTEVSTLSGVEGKATRKVETSAGDARWAKIILECSQERSKIRGLYAPVKTEQTVKGEFSQVLDKLDNEGLDAIERIILERIIVDRSGESAAPALSHLEQAP